MLTKIVVTSDWHLDAITMGQRRLSDIYSAILHSVSTAINRDVDYYIMLGDLCNPNTVRSYEAIAMAIETAAQLVDNDITPIFITGNHDVIEDGSGNHTLLPIRAAGYTVFDHPFVGPMITENSKINMVVLPFTPSSHGYDPVVVIQSNLELLSDKLPTLVLGHLNIEGIIQGSETADMPRGRDVFLPIRTIKEQLPSAVVLNGHYHKRQNYNGVHIPGSLVRLNFGEASNKPGFLYLEI